MLRRHGDLKKFNEHICGGYNNVVCSRANGRNQYIRLRTFCLNASIMKQTLFRCLLLFLPTALTAQQKVDRLIVVTTDGLRWQEVFQGIDSGIAVQRAFNQGDSAALFKKYGGANGIERRKKLLPFFWNTLVKQGQVWGNHATGNKVNTANKYWFSYPGYNEIFTGFPDTAINSNDLPDNPHVNVLEFLNWQPRFKGRVAAFTAWNAFNRILAERRSGFPVVAAFDTIAGKNLTTEQRLLNRMLLNSYRPWRDAECLDVFTHYSAMSFLKSAKPNVLYISYGETDEWAHAGQYRDYLNAAHQVDAWLQELWTFIQTDPAYKNKTALLITVDHGRGRGKEWTSHGENITGADEIWFAVVAPGLPAKGEVKTAVQLHQQGFAQTIANLLGVQFKADHPIAPGLLSHLK